MKIAIMTHAMEVDGVSRFVLALGDYLTANGDDVTVVAVSAQREWWGMVAAANMHGALMPRHTGDSRVSHALRLASYLAHNRFDAVISNIGWTDWAAHQSLSFLPDAVAAVVVLHGHDEMVYHAAKISSAGWNVAVAVSPQVERTIAAILPHKPVRLIPNGLPCPTDLELAGRSAWRLPLRLLYVGRLVEPKGVFLLPDILRNCRALGVPVSLTIVGAGDGEAELKARLLAADVDKLVEFMGLLPGAEVIVQMRRHHALLLPSHREGLPMVLIEAQANGCVPVASLLPGSTDAVIVDHTSGLLAPPGDDRAFAERVEGLTEAQRWRTLSRNGIVHARTYFSQETMGRRYAALLREAVGGGQTLIPRQRQRWRRLLSYSWREYLPLGLRTTGARLLRRTIRSGI